jgi:hypothetical protein
MADEDELAKLSQEVSRIATSLERLSDPLPGHGAAESPALDVGSVRRMINVRKRRGNYLPGELLCEPGWNMLLDLLDAELSKRQVSVTSVCGASGVPQTTALRCVQLMVDHRYLVRHKDKSDGRRVYLELAPEISGALRRYIVEVVQMEPAAA